jgi:hypothetical protein
MTEQTIFLAALEIEDPVARATYLEKACGEDAALRRQVMSLFGAHERSGEFLDVPVVKQVGPSPSETNDGAVAFNSGTENHGSVGARNDHQGPVDAQTESQDNHENRQDSLDLPCVNRDV